MSSTVPLSTKLYYGVGAIAYGVKDNGLAFILLIYYSQVLGLEERLVGLAMFIALIVDAISDPIVGHISDNFRSKWGRRHPFLYAAALPAALSYFFLWNPPESLSQSELFFYLVFMVDRIVDIVDEDLDIDIGTASDGLIGSAVVKGKATEIVDVGYHLKRSSTNWFRKADQQSGGVSQQRSVLFIDDSSFFRELVTPHLRAAGYKVTSLDNATDALKLLAGGEQYDLIISDIEMPDVNGLAFATQIRADDSTAEIPLIAMSSRAASHVSSPFGV